MGAVLLARAASKAYKCIYLWKFRGAIAQCLKNLNRIIYACDIAYQVEIPKSLRLPHQGLGVVIHPQTVIGENCTIYQNVTLGATVSKVREEGCQAPIIGNNVMIGAGAVILGGISVGSNVQIGANSVVLHNVPDNVMVAGVPAEIKKRL